MELAAVILAAGKGTRMKSKLPKVLHNICGRSMISYVMDAVVSAGVKRTVVVVGYGAETVAHEVGEATEIACQAEQLGTAHALMQAGPLLKGFDGHLLVLCGDTPLIEVVTLSGLIQRHIEAGLSATVLTAVMEDPTGYGRVIRERQGKVLKIVEEKDASLKEKQVREINTGIYCFKADGLFETLEQVGPANAQGEYYLTDVIERYVCEGREVGAVVLENPAEVTGINDRVQLAVAERYMRGRIVEDLMKAGVTVVDPPSTFIDRQVRIGRDTTIYPFTFIEGDTVIGEDCIIGPGSRIADATVGNGVRVQNAVVTESSIGDCCLIGPFAYLRPGTKLGKGIKVGDFVEIKNSQIGDGSKVPHLSYVGDAIVGEKVNIGCGTVTCNYDGRGKWLTRIGDGAFIGSNTNLVAPVEVGAGAYTGAGSTITKDIPAGALGVERAGQKVVPDWSGKIKRKKE